MGSMLLLKKRQMPELARTPGAVRLSGFLTAQDGGQPAGPGKLLLGMRFDVEGESFFLPLPYAQERRRRKLERGAGNIQACSPEHANSNQEARGPCLKAEK